MPADYSRVHRLLKIITLIQGADGWTPGRLAGEFGVTERTIYRDMEMLEGAGIPYFFDREAGQYRIRRDFLLSPVQLSLDETLALASLAEQVGGREQVPFTRAASRAIAKVRGVLPDKLRGELEQIERHVDIRLAASVPAEVAQDVYETLRRAIVARQAVDCEYVSLAGNLNVEKLDAFCFHPYALFFSTRAWYVVGHHEGRGEVRCLKLNRFTGIKPTTKPYEIPDGFSLDEHLGNAWRMIRGKERYEVELHFDAAFAETIADTHWHRTQQIQEHDDRSITFRCSVDGLDEIVWWVLSMGPHCRVVSPDALRDRVRELAAGVLEQYPEARQ